jgi:glucose 1-dehydrogenase
MGPLNKKIALVTGASRGIGAAIAIDLARAGADIVLNYNRSPAAAAAVQTEIRSFGRSTMLVQADVSRLDQVRAMFDRIEAEWSPVDILVNNAGIEPRLNVDEFDEANYDAVFDTNLKGSFFCAQRALGPMKTKGWGRVINISSIHESKPHPPSSVYSMGKAGLWMMTRELAVAYSRYGITINSVAPGAIRTDINREVLDDPAYQAQVLAKIPACRIGEPDDVAHVVTFLAGEGARYITGASVVVDGGLGL